MLDTFPERVLHAKVEDGRENLGFLELPENLNPILEFAKQSKDFTDKRQVNIRGFSLTGSRALGYYHPGSDFDFSVPTKDYKQVSVGQLSFNGFHVVEPVGNFDQICDLILSLADGPVKYSKYSDAFFGGLYFLLGGIPFGEELQNLQREVLEFIGSLPPDKFKKFWNQFSYYVHKAESGKLGINKEGLSKYGLYVPRKIPYLYFVKRWENRCKVANQIAEKHNMQF